MTTEHDTPHRLDDPDCVHSAPFAAPSQSKAAPAILFLTTASDTAMIILQNQIREVERRGFRVHVASAPPANGVAPFADSRISFHPVAMRREISLISDLTSLFRLWRLMRSLRPALVHAHTPKASMLGMMAAAGAGVKVRIRTINGFRHATATGWRRRLVASCEALTCRLADRVYCVSESLRREAVETGVCPADRIKVLGRGGSHGVDLDRYDPQALESECRSRMRSQYRLPLDSVVITFVGRIVRDKGVEDLAAAWETLRRKFPNVHLLLCGTPEPQDPIAPEIWNQLRSDPQVRMTDGSVSSSEMPLIYAMSDICVLPSHREGLPNVALECGAMEIPMVATRIPGCMDAVQDGETGLLVEPRNPAALYQALARLVQDENLRHALGKAARRHVAAHFSEKRITELLVSEYSRLLA